MPQYRAVYYRVKLKYETSFIADFTNFMTPTRSAWKKIYTDYMLEAYAHDVIVHYYVY